MYKKGQFHEKNITFENAGTCSSFSLNEESRNEEKISTATLTEEAETEIKNTTFLIITGTMVFPLFLCYDSDMNKYYFCSIARLWIPIHFWRIWIQLLAQCESVKKLLWCGFLTLLKLTPISYRYEKDVSKVKKITWSWSKFI